MTAAGRAGWAAAGGAAFLYAMFVPTTGDANREFSERLMDAVHVPFFAAVAAFLHHLNPAGLATRPRRAVAAGIAATTMAAATELIQPFTGRGGSFIDFVNGVLGIALAVAVCGGWGRSSGGLRLLVLGGAAVACALIALRPAWREFRGIVWRERHFPLLGDFESADEFRIWRASEGDGDFPSAPIARSTSWATHGLYSMAVNIRPGAWPGVRLLTGEQDWRGYAALALDVENPGGTFTLAVRIDDAASRDHKTRYHDALVVTPGLNHVRIPLAKTIVGPGTRPLDLAHIRRLVLFVDHATVPRQFRIDHVRLER